MVCCDGCGIDVTLPNQEQGVEYGTEQIARSVRDWAATHGGWLLRDPNTEEQWLTCPECSAIDRQKMSVVTLTLVHSSKE